MGDYLINTDEDAMEVEISPYFDASDFSALEMLPSKGPVDPISIADLLRNAFVCPPYSIYRDVRVASAGFRNSAAEAPGFRFPFSHEAAPQANVDAAALVDRYHRLLCDAIRKSTRDIRRPWLLQSGGKDSTSLAIAMAEARPDATCVTYLGGTEENEVESARLVCDRLGLRHVTLTCNPGRAYERYLALVPRMPLLTADFALLSYADLAVEAASQSADGLVDGLGSDCYFGMPTPQSKRFLLSLARHWRWPGALLGLPFARDNFLVSYLLGTLQMGEERHFPGSRFSDSECDFLLGKPLSEKSRLRMEVFRTALDQASDIDRKREILTLAAEAAAGFAKGIYTAQATSLRLAFPYCDPALSDWVCTDLPAEKRKDRFTNKVLVREHITTRFGALPYVARKGCFRFDLVGLAADRFDQVAAFAEDARALVPGAAPWLRQNRTRMANKFYASRFYLLAVLLPWLLSHSNAATATGAVDRRVALGART